MTRHTKAAIIVVAIIALPYMVDFTNYNLPAFTALALGFAGGYFFNIKSAQK